MKRILSLVLALAMIFGLAACTKTPDPSQPAGSDPAQTSAPTGGETKESTKETEKPKTWVKELTIPVTPPDVLDPQVKSDNASDTIYKMIYNQLVAYNWDERKFEPELATSWEISPDGLIYTFHLREDVTFSNGQPFEADDVVFTFFDRAKQIDEAGGAALSAYYKMDKTYVEAVDAHTVRFVRPAPNSDFMFSFYLQHHSILNREACEADPTKGLWVGTNGWILQSYEQGEKAVVTKYADSWVYKINGETPTEKVTFARYSEEGTKVAALETGEICLATGLDRVNQAVLDPEKFQTTLFSAQTEAYAYFNMVSGVAADDVNLRSAIAFAMNRDDINKAVYDGTAVIAKTIWSLDQYGYYDGFAEPITYDVAKAKSYLAKSAYPDGNFTLKLWVTAKYENAGILLQKQLQENLGCKVEFAKVDTNRINASVKKIRAGEATEEDRFDMIIQNISLNPSGCRFNFFGDPKSSTNRAMYDSEWMQGLFKEAQETTDESRALAIYRELQEFLNTEKIWVPLMYESNSYTIDVRVSGVQWSPDTKHDYSLIRMSNEY